MRRLLEGQTSRLQMSPSLSALPALLLLVLAAVEGRFEADGARRMRHHPSRMRLDRRSMLSLRGQGLGGGGGGFACLSEKAPALDTPIEGGGGGVFTSSRTVMMDFKDEGTADPAVVAAMLGLRNHGEENRTLTPLAVDTSSTPPGAGYKEIARFSMDGEYTVDGEDARVETGLAGGLAQLKEDEIRTPDTDKRAYKHIKLSNGLQAVLVSDPEAHSAAAALCVSVGQLDDPSSVQGLAHFLEHMLFLGTEKYPEESNFDQFCASAAGYSNAWTSLDHTMFHFFVAKSKLQEALDRFASFFSCPLFAASGTEREMKAVDSEHNKNLQDDDRREHQLLRGTSSSSHPMSRFGAGNLRTLLHLPQAADPPVDVRQELLAFHKEQYVASRMRLAVIGHESLQEIQKWVESSFEPIPDTPSSPLTQATTESAATAATANALTAGGQPEEQPEMKAKEKVEGEGGDAQQSGSTAHCLRERAWTKTTAFDKKWKRAFFISPVSERRQLALYFP